MLTPKQLQEIVETMQPILDGLNVWITKDIIKRVMARLGRGEDLELTSTDVWQAQVYRDLGGHYEALQRQLMAFTEAAEDEVKQIFQYTGLTAYDADAKMYHQGGLTVPPLRQSPRILQVLEDTYRRTNGEISNFTRTTATATQQRLIQALDKAHIMVMSGATSYATAVKEIVDELAEHQAYVRYPTGHTDTLEVAVLRAVRTGTAQASGNMSIGTMEQYGWEIVLTSAHLGARYGDGGQNPGNHFWWQGRFFSRTGKDPRFPPFIESTGYGTGEGLCGWNCRHSFGPGNGVHNPWMKYDAEENKRAYDLSQMQRKKERDIRSQTKKVEAFKEAVAAAQTDDVRKAMQEALKDEQGKLTNLRKDYGNFCDENDLKRQAFRLQVAKAKQQEVERAYYSSSPVSKISTYDTANKIAAPINTAPIKKPQEEITSPTEPSEPVQSSGNAPATSESLTAQTEQKPASYQDVTENWYPDSKPGSHEVQDLQTYEVNGQTYTVDGKNVVLDYKPHEKAVAEILARDVGGETFMVPRVNNPQGVSTPDILFNGEKYDLKTINPGATSNTLFNRVQKAIKQADRFILDVTDSGLSEDIINEQIRKIFWSKHTKTVKEIVIVSNNKIDKVMRRND